MDKKTIKPKLPDYGDDGVDIWPDPFIKEKVTKCPKCGIELHQVMMYYCSQNYCPCGLGNRSIMALTN